jgi:hypothetical protein
MLRPCLRCGALSTRGSYCRLHAPSYSKRNPARGNGWDATKFRRAVLMRAGYRCEAVENGVRCEVRGPGNLQAHHVAKITEGGDPHDPRGGRALCHRHHRLIDAA